MTYPISPRGGLSPRCVALVVLVLALGLAPPFSVTSAAGMQTLRAKVTVSRRRAARR